MNILMVSSNYPPAVGGPAASVPYLSKLLSDSGFNVHVLTQGYHGCPHLTKEDNFFVHRSKLIEGTFYSPYIALQKIILMCRLGAKIIKNSKIELIHSHDPNISAIVGLLLKTLFKIPGIVKYSGDLVWEFLSLTKWGGKTFEEFLKSGGIRVNFLKNVERKILMGYDIVIAQTKYQKKVLENFVGIPTDRIEIIPNGIETQNIDKEGLKEFKERLKGNFLISTACRLVPWKGVKYLIEAVNFLPEDVSLVIFGEGPEREELIKLTKKNNVDKRVIFWGKVPHEKIQTFIRATNVFVLPSLYEPAGIALLDAFAAQVPVVATKVGGIPEMVENGKTGLLVKPRDPLEIVKGVNKIIENQDLRERIRGNQRKAIKKYLWKNLVQEYINTYQKLLNSY